MAISLSLGNFYGIDSLIDTLIVIVSFMIFSQSKRIYNLIKDKNFNYFSKAFLLVAIAYIFKVFYNLTWVYHIKIVQANLVQVFYEQLEVFQYLHLFSFILYKIFLIGGFLTLFLIFTKEFKKEQIILVSYLALIVIFCSILFNFIFYLTLVLVLFFITTYFYENYKKSKSKNSMLVFISFLIILFSNIVGIFYEFNPFIYLLQEVLLFFGFVILWINHFVFKTKNEKTYKIRDNKRHT